jgi:eukaryotic-like serine/threonine-protein kinase
MTAERWKHVEALYHAARERREVLANADPALRQEVENLLAEDSGDKILDRLAVDLVSESTVTSKATGSLLGPYRIEALIGAGGMGQVFRATDTRLGRPVAIKTSYTQFSEHFEREARAISALNHPHICTLNDVGPSYLVMELVEGETPEGPLPPAQMERIALQIADALDAAHEKGITHRDLKQPTSRSRWMAPEQALGKAVDKRADIWAFGVVIWELLTGERLFQGESSADVLGKVLEQEIDLDRVRRLLERCLNRDVKTRFMHWAAS